MMTVPDELVIAGIARAMAEWLGDPETREVVARHIAEAQKSELMTTAEAAELLRTTPATLLENHVAWKLDVSDALGMVRRPDGSTRMAAPRFFRSQIMAQLHASKVKGRTDDGEKTEEGKVTNFPKQRRKAS